MTKLLTKARFDLFAIGTRLSQSRLIADELSCWSDLDENVIGVVFRDTVDVDFGWASKAMKPIRQSTCCPSYRAPSTASFIPTSWNC